MSDQNYGGLAKYNLGTGNVEANTANALKSLAGVTPQPGGTSDLSTVGKGVYGLGRSGAGKWLTDQFTGGDSVVGQQISDSSHGVFNLERPGHVGVDRTKLPTLIGSKIKTWMTANPEKAWGIGLGAGALALGGLAMHGASKAQASTPIAAPGKPQYAGRQGNVFTQALTA